MGKTSTSGQGRPKGATNKVTRELKAILAGHDGLIEKELVRLCLHAESEATRVAAIKEFNDRRFGKPLQQVEVGKPGDFDNMSDHDLVDIVRNTARETGVRRPRRNGTDTPPESESLH